MNGTGIYQEWQKEHWGICAQEHVFFMRDGFSGLPLYAPMTANMNEAESLDIENLLRIIRPTKGSNGRLPHLSGTIKHASRCLKRAQSLPRAYIRTRYLFSRFRSGKICNRSWIVVQSGQLLVQVASSCHKVVRMGQRWRFVVIFVVLALRGFQRCRDYSRDKSIVSQHCWRGFICSFTVQGQVDAPRCFVLGL